MLLNLEKLFDSDCLRLCNCAQIVAQKVYNHNIFGAILGILRKKTSVSRVLVRRFAALNRAFHRFCQNLVAFQPKKQLGRKRHNCLIIVANKGIIRCFLLLKQFLVQLKSVCARFENHRICVIDLICVSRSNLLLNKIKSAPVLGKINHRDKR